jgi:hypothetical protein
MNIIRIIEDTGLPERAGRINKKTWTSIKTAKGNSAFFPDGDQIIVASNPFEPQYILFAVDEDLEDDTLYVSSDIKALLYSNKDFLKY